MASAAKEPAERARLLLMNIARHLRQLPGVRVTAVRAGEVDAVLLVLLPDYLAELLTLV